MIDQVIEELKTNFKSIYEALTKANNNGGDNFDLRAYIERSIKRYENFTEAQYKEKIGNLNIKGFAYFKSVMESIRVVKFDAITVVKIETCMRDRNIFKEYYSGVNDILYMLTCLLYDNETSVLKITRKQVKEVIERLKKEIEIISNKERSGFDSYEKQLKEALRIDRTLNKFKESI